ncbi:MAG TPA: hypothetical protein PK095_17620, partial [Myxococcota bacterium]|nr:hypothetical protein [Myxococcota bacterium]
VEEKKSGETSEQHEERISTKLKRDVERLEKSIAKLEPALEKWKALALESGLNAKRFEKRMRDAQSMQNITQSQLDHALDEIYFLKHGEAPEHPQVEKGKKRAALKPKEQALEVKRD